jgi:hypothetical protein
VRKAQYKYKNTHTGARNNAGVAYMRLRLLALLWWKKTEGGHETCQLFQLSSFSKLASILDITQEDGTPR